MSRTEEATERRPLLLHPTNEHDRRNENQQQTSYDADGNDEENTPDAARLAGGGISTRELLVVMGATWVGVFLAALGMFSLLKSQE